MTSNIFFLLKKQVQELSNILCILFRTWGFKSCQIMTMGPSIVKLLGSEFKLANMGI